MRTIALRLGPLAEQGCRMHRSGLRWLLQDGQICKRGQIIAYCNVGVMVADQAWTWHDAFMPEQRDFQVAFVAKVAGRIAIAAGSSRGGLLDQLDYVDSWDPEFSIGTIACDSSSERVSGDYEGGPAQTLGLLFAAGRRIAEHAEIRDGLLTGWHSSTRAWDGNASSVDGTLLSLGSCELTGALRGEQPAFLEFISAQPGPTQLVAVTDDLLVPCARVTHEQTIRTDDEIRTISADFAATFPFSAEGSMPADWIFAGTLLAALRRSPLNEGNHVLTRGGIRYVERPDAVVMSMIAEPRTVFRHRHLGYTVSLHRHRLDDLSEAVSHWLRERFEAVTRDPSDIQADWRALIDAVRSRSPMRFLVLNVMSSNMADDFLNYAQFDQPMHRLLGSIHSKEINLMLHDLAAERDIDIVDVDAIVTEFGAARHLPDGVHLSGAVQAEVRREIGRILAARAIPGFCAG